MDEHLSRGSYRIQRSGALRGTIQVPGDKSISHRAVMLASLAEGTTSVIGFLESEDCIATLNAFEKMGVVSERNGDRLLIHGQGMHGLHAPSESLDMGNSGTGTRLLMGILAGQHFPAVLTGDSSLCARPMGRVIQPLQQMGAEFSPLQEGSDLPLRVLGGSLTGIQYQSPVASAQIKSALLFAGLQAEGNTEIFEPALSRDHTERMLKTFGITMDCGEKRCSISGGQTLKSRDVMVPGDFSSAAFFMVAASIIPDSEILIQNVGVNPTRTGLMDILNKMGAEIITRNERYYGAEPVADILVRYRPMKGIKVNGGSVVRMIDEFPIFAVAAAFASSPSLVEEAAELRVKESDRIAVIVEELSKLGLSLGERNDGFEVSGGGSVQGAGCFSHGDHRIAMALAVAGLAARGETVIQGTDPVATSFPNFFDLLNELSSGKVTPVP